MKTTLTRRAAGFTLVELLVTITIMVMLAGLIVGGFAFVQDRQARETARLQITLLSRGIDEYQLDMGVYPGTGQDSNFGGDASSADGLNSDVLYKSLYYEGLQAQSDTTISPTAASEIYVVELDPVNNRQGWLDRPAGNDPPDTNVIRDPWGREYRYRVGDNAMNPDFDLWSSGKDGRTDHGSSESPYDADHPDNRDDIRNF